MYSFALISSFLFTIVVLSILFREAAVIEADFEAAEEEEAAASAADEAVEEAAGAAGVAASAAANGWSWNLIDTKGYSFRAAKKTRSSPAILCPASRCTARSESLQEYVLSLNSKVKSLKRFTVFSKYYGIVYP